MIPKDLVRASIRHLRQEDFCACYHLETDPEVKNFLKGPIRRSEDDLRSNFPPPQDEALLAIADLKSDKFIGRCGLLKAEEQSLELEFHCVLHPAYWRKGIASVVIPFLIDLASTRGRLAVGFVDPQNTASIELMNRLGLANCGLKGGEGWQRKHFKYVANMACR